MTGSISRRLLLPGPTAPPLAAPLLLAPRPAAMLRCKERALELEPPANQVVDKSLEALKENKLLKK